MVLSISLVEAVVEWTAHENVRNHGSEDGLVKVETSTTGVGRWWRFELVGFTVTRCRPFVVILISQLIRALLLFVHIDVIHFDRLRHGTL